MRRPRPALSAFALLVLVTVPSAATTRPPPSPLPPGAEAPLPPYEGDLERLAELMGTLAFMRDLCGASAGADWRDRMATLLAAEGVTDERRARLAGRFNRGYDGYRLTYRRCTPAAETVIARALAEGVRLSGVLSRAFGAE